MNYDDVGNLTLDTYTSTLTAGMHYDAENMMTSAANGGQQYRYNADGKRVKRIITGTGGGTYWMVYGIGGELVAEYNATSGIPAVTNASKEYGYRGGQMLIVAESTTAVKWLVQDHLGSTRMEIATGGAIGDVTRHDYLPFGEELAGTMRSAANGYGTATNTKQKFATYERDVETGLDFAQARMYASVQGRFTSVDPDGIGAAKAEPQSWNGYSYVGNHPTTMTDSSGLRWFYNTITKDYGWCDCTTASKDDVAKGWVTVSFDESKPFENREARDGYDTKQFYVYNPDGSNYWANPNAPKAPDMSGSELPGAMLGGPVGNLLGRAIGSVIAGTGSEIITLGLSQGTISTATAGVSSQVGRAVGAAATETTEAVGSYAEGSFSVFRWNSYPMGGIRPTGPVRILEGAEYTAARNAANLANRAIHRANPGLRGFQIHEIQPVKFGGSPIDFLNKIILMLVQYF